MEVPLPACNLVSNAGEPFLLLLLGPSVQPLVVHPTLELAAVGQFARSVKQSDDAGSKLTELAYSGTTRRPTMFMGLQEEESSSATHGFVR